MPQSPEAVVWRIEHLLTGHRQQADGRSGSGLGRLAQQQVLKANAQFLHRPILGQRCLIVESSIPVVRRVSGVRGRGQHEQKHSEQEQGVHVTPQ
ncbi:hypothetical protein D3C76_1723700 [compost metagenome]